MTAANLKATFDFTMYVCLCTGVTDGEIRKLAAEGVSSIDEVGRCTGAGTKCGSCRRSIGALLAGGDPSPGVSVRRLRMARPAA